MRFVSLLLRHRQSQKAVKRIEKTFRLWKETQQSLPIPAAATQKLLLIRLDDIGDYLLFRNSLAVYKNAPRWSGHELVLLGNRAWAGLFDALDGGQVDRVIWVDKPAYLGDEAYRLALWAQLRNEGFDTVVCPSRTRPLLLDDCCVMASGAAHRIASANSFVHPEWNELSDSLYTELFRGEDPLIHEFFFNLRFAEWCCGEAVPGLEEKDFSGRRPEILLPPVGAGGGIAAGSGSGIAADRGTVIRGGSGMKREAYILFFIGSSTKSKQWPEKRWIELARLLGKKYAYRIVIAGGKQEAGMAAAIQGAVGGDVAIEPIAGKYSLAEMIDWVAGAAAVITNDTMAAHLGPSCNRPTLIIASGTNSLRFTNYTRAGIGKVITAYPRAFLRAREKRAEGSFHHTAVSADIASIKAEEVAEKLEGLIGPPGVGSAG